MPILFSSPKAPSSVVAASHTTTDPFVDADDVTTNKPCLVTQVHLALPAGEACDIFHVSAAGNVSIVRASAPVGPYLLGEHFILHPGEALRFTSVGTPISGTREAVVKARQIGGA